MKRVFHIVSNPVAIAINQHYSLHPGYLAFNSSETFIAKVAHNADSDPHCITFPEKCEEMQMPKYQVWSKPILNKVNINI